MIATRTRLAALVAAVALSTVVGPAAGAAPRATVQPGPPPRSYSLIEVDAGQHPRAAIEGELGPGPGVLATVVAERPGQRVLDGLPDGAPRRGGALLQRPLEPALWPDTCSCSWSVANHAPYAGRVGVVRHLRSMTAAGGPLQGGIAMPLGDGSQHGPRPT